MFEFLTDDQLKSNGWFVEPTEVNVETLKVYTDGEAYIAARDTDTLYKIIPNYDGANWDALPDDYKIKGLIGKTDPKPIGDVMYNEFSATVTATCKNWAEFNGEGVLGVTL